VTTALAVLGLGLSIVALGVSVVVARNQLRQSSITNAQPLAIDLFREFRERSADRRRLHKELPKIKDSAKGFESIADEELQQLARSTSHWYDNIGVLVAHGMVEPEYVAGFLGTSAIDTWNLLKRFIVGDRECRKSIGQDDDYQDYFEYLVRLRFEGDLPPREVRRRVMPKLYELRGGTGQ
jgi:hypothetical protein